MIFVVIISWIVLGSLYVSYKNNVDDEEFSPLEIIYVFPSMMFWSFFVILIGLFKDPSK
jgi:hypothetical protein